MKCHRFHVRRKMKENNGKLKKIEASLIKKSSKDELVPFKKVSHSSLSRILGNLEDSCSTLALDQESKGRSNK